MAEQTYKVNEGQLLTYLLFVTFFVSLINFVYVLNLNINFVSTILVSIILLIKNRIFINKWFLISIGILLVFLLIAINYYSLYFSIFYFTVIVSYFIGLYSPRINLPDFFKKLFFLALAMNLLYYIFITHSPFIIEGGKQRMISISGGPPATSFVYLSFFLVFFHYKKIWLLIPALVLLILTGNRISILTAFFIIGLYFFLNLSLKKILIILGIMLVLILIIINTELDRFFLEKARFIDKRGNWNFATFEGRLVHWKWAIIHFKNASLWHKLFGHGINSTKEIFFTTNVYMGQRTGSGAMHNEYLRILVENGIAGILVIVSLLFNLLKKAFQSQNKFLFLSLTLTIMITAITDNILYSYYNYLLIVFFLLGYHLKHSYKPDATV